MKLNKLTANQVARARPYQAGELRKTGKKKGLPYQGGEPKRYGDGGGLHLVVDGPQTSLNRKWVFRFTWHGKPAECGMGGYGTTLAEARTKAADARRMVRAGINPIEDKRADRARVATPTFGACALALIKSKQSEWRNVKHRSQWRVTLETCCAPIWALNRPSDSLRAGIARGHARVWRGTLACDGNGLLPHVAIIEGSDTWWPVSVEGVADVAEDQILFFARSAQNG